MVRIHRVLEAAFYLFFGMMIFGACLVVMGLLIAIFSFGILITAYEWGAGWGGSMFGIGFVGLFATAIVGVFTGWIR